MKELVLGITGSIAAYKSYEIIRRLIEKGWQVTCILTPSSLPFVSPLVLTQLTGRKVYTDLFDVQAKEIEHISLAQRATMVAIVPATANTISKLAYGIADNLLTTFVLSVTCPVLIAPAMNELMYVNPVVQENIKILTGRGFYFCGPEKGFLACGMQGYGRLSEPQTIVTQIERLGTKTYPNLPFSLLGKTVLITAGPTREYIDPVRYLSNSSSGKMGLALVQTAKQYGAKIIYITGNDTKPVVLDEKDIYLYTPTAKLMYTAVRKNFNQTDWVIATAAVCDYRPLKFQNHKIKADKKAINLRLTRNVDILAELGKNKGNKLLAGFALETKNLSYAVQNKIRQKNLDLMVVNTPRSLENDFTDGKIYVRRGEKIVPVSPRPNYPKKDLAVDVLYNLYQMAALPDLA